MFLLFLSFTLTQVMSAPFASAPVAAPNGARVAWLENDRGKRNVWVAGAPDWQGRKVTAFDKDDGQEIAELAWAPDGSYLLFARGGDFENGGDNPNPDLSPTKPEQEIWYATLNGAPAKKLTEGRAPHISPNGETVAFLRGGQIFTMKPSGAEVKNVVTQKATAADLQWSPDSSALAFVSDRRNHSLIGLYLPAEKSLRYLDASVDHDTDPSWSPDGTHIAYVRIPTGGPRFGPGPRRQGEPWSIHVADAKTGEARQVFQAASGPGSVFHPIDADQQIFWTAGDRLVFPWERTGWCHLYSLPLRGDTAGELTPGEGEVEHAALSHDGKTMYFAGNFEDGSKDDIDRRHLWSVQPNAAPKQLTTGEDIEYRPTPLADGSALAFLSTSYNQRAHAMVQMADGKTKPLTPPVVLDSLVVPQPVVVTAADGMPIHAQLFLPPKGTNIQRHPALVFFHGGSRRQMLLGFHYMYYYSNITIPTPTL